MGNFNKGNRSSGGKGGKKFGGKRAFEGRSFGGDRGGSDRGASRGGFGGGRDGKRPAMHRAICSACGKECEVPFRPTGDKPVFCSDCFRKKGDDNSRNFGDRGNRDFGERNSRPRFDDKRSYQKDGGKSSENYKAQFEILNAKLDKILKALASVASKETREKEIEPPKFKKFERAPKKEVETVALKKVITKAISKKPTAKKLVTKKPTSKKVAVKNPVKKKVTKKKK